MTAPDRDDKVRVNLGYVLGQLDRALGSTGETAAARVTQWRRVLAGIFAGSLRPGSRTPVDVERDPCGSGGDWRPCAWAERAGKDSREHPPPLRHSGCGCLPSAPKCPV